MNQDHQSIDLLILKKKWYYSNFWKSIFQKLQGALPNSGGKKNQYVIFEEFNHQTHQSIAFSFLIKKILI